MKRIIVYISLLILLIGCSIIPATTDNNLGENEIIAWQEDVDYLVEQLEENHPNPYFSISEKTFDKEVGKLKADIPQLN